MSEFQVRRGIGWVPRTRRPIWLYAAMKDGRTLQYFETWEAAWDYLNEWYPQTRHDNRKEA